MTNTPIQSDEELRLKIYNAVREGVKQVKFPNSSQYYLLHVDAVDDVLEIIKAYSEQKALDFGVQLLKETIQEAPIADYEGLEGNVYNARHPNHKYMLKKIAELQAQLTSQKEEL